MEFVTVVCLFQPVLSNFSFSTVSEWIQFCCASQTIISVIKCVSDNCSVLISKSQFFGTKLDHTLFTKQYSRKYFETAPSLSRRMCLLANIKLIAIVSSYLFCGLLNLPIAEINSAKFTICDPVARINCAKFNAFWSVNYDNLYP